MRQILARLQRTYCTPRYITLRTPKNLTSGAKRGDCDAANEDENNGIHHISAIFPSYIPDDIMIISDNFDGFSFDDRVHEHLFTRRS